MSAVGFQLVMVRWRFDVGGESVEVEVEEKRRQREVEIAPRHQDAKTQHLGRQTYHQHHPPTTQDTAFLRAATDSR